MVRGRENLGQLEESMWTDPIEKPSMAAKDE